MSEYKWIKDSGTVKADELFMDLKKYKWEGKRFLAYHTDSFKAGHAADAELAGLNVSGKIFSGGLLRKMVWRKLLIWFSIRHWILTQLKWSRMDF